MLKAIAAGSTIRLINLSTARLNVAVKATMLDGSERRAIVSFDGASLQSKVLPWLKDEIVRIESFLIKGTARSLYISRPVTNAGEIVAWAKDSGFKQMLLPEDMHCTIAFSRQKMDWNSVGSAPKSLTIPGGTQSGKRSVIRLGDKGAVVLKFESADLERRWRHVIDCGASWDYDGYRPHITITYDGGDMSLSGIKPYSGELRFGPEKLTEVVEDWETKIKEA
jgi:hypothetical protein